MEWFKHKTNAHNDPVVADAWDEFGDAGYTIWFVLLEIYGQQFSTVNPNRKLDVSKAFLRRKFRKSWTKVEQILSFYATFGKLKLDITDKRVVIEIPKFKDILSNWTRRITLTPTESPTESPTAIDKSKNKSKNKVYTSSGDEGDFYITKKKRKLNGKRYETFNLFWNAFNYKLGKAEAADAWLDIPQLTNGVVDQIIRSAKNEAKRRPSLQEQGKIPKMAQGWLSGRRWEDELNQENSIPQATTASEFEKKIYGK